VIAGGNKRDFELRSGSDPRGEPHHELIEPRTAPCAFTKERVIVAPLKFPSRTEALVEIAQTFQNDFLNRFIERFSLILPVSSPSVSISARERPMEASRIGLAFAVFWPDQNPGAGTFTDNRGGISAAYGLKAVVDMLAKRHSNLIMCAPQCLPGCPISFEKFREEKTNGMPHRKNCRF
jgi:hypothetical protein